VSDARNPVLEILKDDENWGGGNLHRGLLFRDCKFWGLIQDTIHAYTHKLLLKLGL